MLSSYNLFLGLVVLSLQSVAQRFLKGRLVTSDHDIS